MKIRSGVAVAVLLAAAAGTSFAQAGADTYKAKCAMCHGATGMADSAAGKSMKVKPVTDPSVKAMDEAKMIAAVKNGMGKMQPYAGKLTDAQIKDAVTHFRSLIK